MSVRVLIGSDVCPTDRDAALFAAGDAQALFGDLLDDLRRADLRFVNLECPLTDRSSPIDKTGPCLRAAGNCVNALRAAKIDVVGLANNHALDQGARALQETIQSCTEAGLAVVGAGANLEEASRVFSTTIRDTRIGIVAVAEHEFSIATDTDWGVNPVDVIEFARRAPEYARDFDLLIVVLHGGNEYYPYPSPGLRKLCRFLIQQGADAVIVQHIHCPGCVETYQGGHIVYGQGNFIYGETGKDRSWYEGFLVEMTGQRGDAPEMKLIPYMQSMEQPGARRMREEEERIFLGQLQTRSREILEPGFVEREWDKFCTSKHSQYLTAALGFQSNRLWNNPLFRFLDRGGRLQRLLYPKPNLLLLTNLVRCEAHREALIAILEREGQMRRNRPETSDHP